jgi:hypothetical protein
MSEARSPHCCPCCGRPFTAVFDYPRVRVLAFGRLPLPEAIDDISDAAAQKAQEFYRKKPSEPVRPRGINMTPEIERACQTIAVKEYLDHLAALTGREISPSELLPPFPADRVFKGAYPVPETPIFLGLAEGDLSPEGTTTTEVEALCKGPSLGSAGGPTLMRLGAIARLTYEGILMGPAGIARESTS